MNFDAGIQAAIEVLEKTFKDTKPTVVAAVLEEDDPRKPLIVTAGVKCLPTDLYADDPDKCRLAVKDMHAEVLAIRTLEVLLTDGFIPLEGKYWLWISEIPCGDAALDEILGEEFRKDFEQNLDLTIPFKGYQGRRFRGACRTKPGRIDSPKTDCMSCSDLLCRWSVLGLCNGCVYLQGLILPSHKTDKKAVFRAFRQRMNQVSQIVFPEPFKWCPFKILWTDLISPNASLKYPSSLALIWTPTFCEHLTKGFLQGTNVNGSIKGKQVSMLQKNSIPPTTEYLKAKQLFHSARPFDTWTDGT